MNKYDDLIISTKFYNDLFLEYLKNVSNICFFIFQKVFKSDLGQILYHAIEKYPDIQYY